MKTAAIILAAGFSSRMGRDKAFLRLDGLTALERVVATHRSAGTERITVVAGRNAEAIGRLGLDVDVIVNRKPEAGMYSSVRLAVAALDGAEEGFKNCFFIHPVDIPLVGPQTLLALTEAAQRHHAADVFIPVFDDRRGHPPLLRDALKQSILDDPGAGGLRAVLASCRQYELACRDEAVILEMNCPEQYERLKKNYFLAGAIAHHGPTDNERRVH